MRTGTRNVGDLAFVPLQAMLSYRCSRGVASLEARRQMEMSGIHPTFYRVLRGFSQFLQATADRAESRQDTLRPLPFTSCNSLFSYHLVIQCQLS